jgi:NAD(P)-dependent dehydrogenase (short-subunit alcohol dehydrogenase family)
MQSRFQDKVVVVTGGARGIGRAAALRFASEGAQLVVVDLPGPELDGCLEALTGMGAKAIAVAADVTVRADVERYVAAACAEFGGIDCLFNNAGILGVVSPLVDYPEEMFDRVIAVNLKAIWMGMKLVAPTIIRHGGGAIVNTASVAGLRASPGLAAYTASKHAVIGLTRTGSVELGRQGVRVNAVCPAPIDNAMGQQLDSGFNPQDPGAAHEKFISRIPLGRYGKPEEVAALAVFLCSADASYINGGIYTVDGGTMS